MNNEINLEWKINCNNNQHSEPISLIQTITKSDKYDEDIDTYFEYFADTVFVNCCINKDADAANYFDGVFDFDFKNDLNLRLYHSFGFLSFYAHLIRKAALIYLKNDLKKSENEWAKLFLNIDTVNKKKTSINEVQEVLSEKCNRLCAALNDIQSKKRNTEEICFDIISDFEKSLGIFSRNSKGLLSEYLFNKRCVGWYIFENKNKKSLISFSGFIDCEEKFILDSLKKTKNYADFINGLKKIAASLNLVLVQLNSKVARYKSIVTDNPYAITYKKITTLEKEINKYSVGDPKINPRYFSCCERKLFTKIKAKNHGELFITKQPCSECVPAIGYFRERGTGVKCTIVYNKL